MTSTGSVSGVSQPGTTREFKLFERDPRRLSGSWRLASHDEVEEHQANLRNEGILDSEVCARLLDGFIYKGNLKIRYKPYNFGSMLAINTEKSRPSDVSFPKEVYDGIKMTPDKRKTALFLSCKDKNTEVILWVLLNLQKESNKDDKFDRLMGRLKMTLSGDRTLLHHAVDQPYFEKYAIEIVRLLSGEFQSAKKMVRTPDKQGKTALHYAAYHGHIDLCRVLITECRLGINDKDLNGENVLHIAVDRKNTELVREILHLVTQSSEASEINSQEFKRTVINSQDCKGKTPLHKAAANGSDKVVQELVDTLHESEDLRLKYVRQADMYGQTALLEGARQGHSRVVKYLLQKGSRPLHERNADGKTALHYAVRHEDGSAKELIGLLLSDEMKCKLSDEEKYLLLWASATGVGTATESTRSPEIIRYLEEKTSKLSKKQKEPLLWTMVINGHVKMALELVSRGANVEDIRYLQGKMILEDQQRKDVVKFLNQIDMGPERGRDQPATEDSLGRSSFAEGLAALFLNPFLKSPFTVGIFGDWGMGKSSIMLQMENLLLKDAAQLAFPDLLEVNSIPGSNPFVTPQNCHYKKLRFAMERLKVEHGLVHLLNNYDQKHEKVYRFLALIDRRLMFATTCKISNSRSKEHPLAKIPSVLTVKYNAWHYQGKMEAWAGLAVQVTKVIEETMTTAQRIRVFFKYVWKQQRRKIWLELILPCLLALFSAGFVTWVAWSVVNRSNIEEKVSLTYGSIPLTIVVIVWTVVRQLLSVIKPISDQVMEYVSLRDHDRNLGYQQRVIDDIQYLKKEFREDPCLVWKLMAWIWNLLHQNADVVEGCIPKSLTASHGEGDLRIIVFVDDLDRCEDEVILQVLSAVNLVLAACEINVVLGVDKKMIAKAIAKKFEDNVSLAENVEDLAEKYISKIIQLPLALPDPDDTETKTFLKQHMCLAFEGTDEDTDSNVDKSEPSPEVEEEETEKGSHQGGARDHVVYVGNCHCPTKKLGGFLSKIWDLFCPRINHCSIEWSCRVEFQEKRLKNLTLKQSYMPNLSKQEQRALLYLRKVATDIRRLPREWKRFLTYHRLAWNIISKKDEIKTLTGWQVQLLVWVFCCWQWKHQINTVIQNWQNIVSVPDEPKTKDKNENEGLSLQTIVDHYMEKIWLPNKEKADGQNHEKPSENKDWKALSKTLRKYDVSMKGIHCFQNFRLHCEVGRLPVGTELRKPVHEGELIKEDHFDDEDLNSKPNIPLWYGFMAPLQAQGQGKRQAAAERIQKGNKDKGPEPSKTAKGGGIKTERTKITDTKIPQTSKIIKRKRPKIILTVNK